jgi:DNA-binding NarL/FixJ family response regulator/DNA-binding SARP family transcriptional activator
VEAYARGVRLDLGPRRCRFVLAVLALDLNRPVAVDRLIELTWPVAAPRTAEHALSVLVSRLRSTLGAAITRQGRAYLLRGDPAAVDAHRFRALVAEARDADDVCALGLLDRALGLWRGEPLAGCTPEGADMAACLDLADARLTAVEDRVDARMRLGRHRAALDELPGLVARHPLRERLAGQLMLALHRDGRTGEALAVYAATRERLADELGLDPGPRLRELQAAVLRDDPAMAPLPAVTTVPRLRVVLVDDHPLFRAGMRTALETGTEIAVVAEAGDVAGAVRAVAECAPDLVVMDLQLPDASGLQATRELLARDPGLPILMLTMSNTDAHIADALRAGARGYVLKSAGRDEVLNAVRTVARGDAVFSADVAARLVAMTAHAPPPPAAGHARVPQ